MAKKRISKGIQKYLRVSKSIQEYPKVSKSILEYPRVHKSIRDYSRPFKVIFPFVLRFAFPRCYIHLRWHFQPNCLQIMALVESWAASAESWSQYDPHNGLGGVAPVRRQMTARVCRVQMPARLAHREIQVIAVRPACSVLINGRPSALPGDARFTRSSCNFDNHACTKVYNYPTMPVLPRQLQQPMPCPSLCHISTSFILKESGLDVTLGKHI